MPESLRQLWTGLRALLVATLALGVVYPVATWAVAQVAFADQASGSLIELDGVARGSRLIGQQVSGTGWFQPRPSAGDYDALASGGSNLGPDAAELAATVTERRHVVAEREDVPPSQVPADAVTASGSGLDAYISPAYAALQVPRVARERGLSAAEVESLVQAHTYGRTWGFLGEPRVNVVELNLALAQR